MAATSQLESQIMALKRRLSDVNRTRTGIEAASMASQLTSQINGLVNQLNQQKAAADPNSQQNQAKTAKDQAEATRKQMLDLGQGGIDRLKGDTTDQMVQNYLKGQMGQQTLDPSNTPFGGNVPQYNAEGYTAQNYTAQGYDPVTGQAQSWNAAQMGDAPMIGGDVPWNAQTRGAYTTEAADAAAGGEAARNQLIRDAILQSGGNASDPSLAGAYAESLSQRNNAVAKARNSLNQRANLENFQATRQADLANQGAKMSQEQFNAANRQQANASNASMAQQMGLANMGAQNQAAQYGASAQNQAGMFNANNQNQAAQYGASARNQAGMFNVGNQMQGTMADFNAGNQARMYNQQQQMGAAGALGNYNNTRQNMLTNAEQNQIGLLGQQRFDVGQPQQQRSGGFPSFQQFSQQGLRSNVTYAPGYFSPMTSGFGKQTSKLYGQTNNPMVMYANNLWRPQNQGKATTDTQRMGTYVNQPGQQQQPTIPKFPTMSQLPNVNLPGVKQPLPPNY